MRILPLVLTITACSQGAPEPSSEKRVYAGAGRDRMCVVGDRIGFISYGEADANCSVRGRLDREALAIVPDGDEDCRIAVREQAGSFTLGTVEASCGYYCGPGVSFEGRSFTENASASPAVDFAGDPLC